MRRILRELLGIAAGLVAWWSLAVMVGILMYRIWPAEGPHIAGLSLAPQNVPGNFLGFVLALYAFRAVTARQSRDED